eukprot:sb/3478959/
MEIVLHHVPNQQMASQRDELEVTCNNNTPLPKNNKNEKFPDKKREKKQVKSLRWQAQRWPFLLIKVITCIPDLCFNRLGVNINGPRCKFHSYRTLTL